MPDVTRSDSQRSDSSLRPRVSFNRDVHVKRIVPREGGRVVGALSGDGNGHLVSSPVRKERLNKSKQQLAEEAAQIIHQADKLKCVHKPRGVSSEKFYTLPTRRKEKVKANYPSASLDRRSRRGSLELLPPPKKPQRTFASTTKPPPQKTSVFDVFKNKKKPSNIRRSVSDASNSRSKNYHHHQQSDGAHSDREEITHHHKKKQLSPIIEQSQREDYFSAANGDEDADDKENRIHNENVNAKSKSVTEQLREYIDEVDEALYRENGYKPSKRKNDADKKDVEVVFIDVDKAEKISNPNKKSKLKGFSGNSIGKKLKSLTTSKKSSKEVSNSKSKPPQHQKARRAPQPPKPKEEKVVIPTPPPLPLATSTPAPRIIEAIESLAKESSPKMIHSSQKPADKLPLTKGRTVDSMVRRLNHDSCSPPPKPSAMVVPNVSVQHNNNQPFSYTRGLSPEKYMSDENLTRPIIYAQVVCNNTNGRVGSKQTVHTAYSKKQPHSDSDEGLGNEEGLGKNKYKMDKSFTHFGDHNATTVDRNDSFTVSQESPILPKYRVMSSSSYYDEKSVFVDSSARGRADGMDAKRRESLSEQVENELDHNRIATNGRSDLSARRDLLESRINRRISDKTAKFVRSGSSSPSPINNNNKTYFGEAKNTSRYGYSDNEPKSFDSQISENYRSSPEHKFETSHNRFTHQQHQGELRAKNLYKSTPNIYHQEQVRTSHLHQDAYHDSLRRERHHQNQQQPHHHHNQFRVKSDKDKFGDSGIENDIIRRDSGDNKPTRQNRFYRDFNNDSEDEGFASSLLIASERQHTEDNLRRRLPKKEYDSDRAYSGEDDAYRHHVDGVARDYVPRERSIDDGSHFDPRIDKEFQKERTTTLKRNEKKPPKPEKKSGLEKMKQLFSRDSKKKKAKADMVREESLRARYTEYRGSRENLDSRRMLNGSNSMKRHDEEAAMDYDYSNRRRLSTPSPSPTRETNEKSDHSHSNNWFKSLDRLSRKKTKKEDVIRPSYHHPNDATPTTKRPSPKNLRFFGDTDDSDSARPSSVLKSRSGISQKDRTRSQSTRELHNISENPELMTKRNVNHKSMVNISESSRSKSNLKPPASPNRRGLGSSRDIHRLNNNNNHKEDKLRRRKYEMSSVESSTEGDSSQQSQRSIVYLHAATVGDIPGPAYLRNGNKRAASREELASNDSSRLIQPQVKTLSRSFSVLAPWKPRHYHEGNDIDYSQHAANGKPTKYEQKPNKNGTSRKEHSTLKKKAQDSRSRNASTLSRPSSHKSKENLTKSWSKEELSSKSSTLYKKKDKLPRENNSRYGNRERDERGKMAAKSMSVESLSRGERRSRESSNNSKGRDISRSLSMPKDPEKSSGWFNNKKKTHKERL